MPPAGLAADQLAAVSGSGNDDALGIDDVDVAAGGQRAKLQRVLKVIEHRPDRQHRANLTGFVLDRACNVEDPAPAPYQDRLANRRAVAGHGFAEIHSIAGIGTLTVRIRRGSDIGPIRSEQQDMRIEIGQRGLDLPQQRVVGAPICRIGRYGLAEHRQQALDVAYMVIDLSGQQPRLVDRAVGRRSAVVLPLTPEPARNQGRQRNHGGEHQPQEP